MFTLYSSLKCSYYSYIQNGWFWSKVFKTSCLRTLKFKYHGPVYLLFSQINLFWKGRIGYSFWKKCKKNEHFPFYRAKEENNALYANDVYNTALYAAYKSYAALYI